MLSGVDGIDGIEVFLVGIRPDTGLLERGVNRSFCTTCAFLSFGPSIGYINTRSPICVHC